MASIVIQRFLTGVTGVAGVTIVDTAVTNDDEDQCEENQDGF
jgi:hypothetical protein